MRRDSTGAERCGLRGPSGVQRAGILRPLPAQPSTSRRRRAHAGWQRPEADLRQDTAGYRRCPGRLVDDVATYATDRQGQIPTAVLVGHTLIDDTPRGTGTSWGENFDPALPARFEELTTEIRRVAQERGVIFADAAQVAHPGDDGPISAWTRTAGSRNSSRWRSRPGPRPSAWPRCPRTAHRHERP